MTFFEWNLTIKKKKIPIVVEPIGRFSTMDLNLNSTLFSIHIRYRGYYTSESTVLLFVLCSSLTHDAIVRTYVPTNGRY